MDIDLKSSLRSKLESIAPEYGLLELSYPSFTRCFGYRSPPLSAADAVEAVSALLDVAGGVRMEVEVEGARNGGEWFGGGRVWEAEGRRAERRGVVREGAGEVVSEGRNRAEDVNGEAEDGEKVEGKVEVDWWKKNFWTAFDALSE
jgi:cell division control protein 45